MVQVLGTQTSVHPNNTNSPNKRSNKAILVNCVRSKKTNGDAKFHRINEDIQGSVEMSMWGRYLVPMDNVQ